MFGWIFWVLILQLPDMVVRIGICSSFYPNILQISSEYSIYGSVVVNLILCFMIRWNPGCLVNFFVWKDTAAYHHIMSSTEVQESFSIVIHHTHFMNSYNRFRSLVVFPSFMFISPIRMSISCFPLSFNKVHPKREFFLITIIGIICWGIDLDNFCLDILLRCFEITVLILNYTGFQLIIWIPANLCFFG